MTNRTEFASNAQVTLTIEGMTCGSCASNVRQALRPLDGVFDVDVDVQAARAVVTYDPEELAQAELVRAIEGAGYVATVQQA